ncbi:tetratricopeptide repeat protein [Streptomyces sp. CA-106131]|uniref:tetratricopeptide repeat protein n=1 Tax=Streptomyces sp. CA-106131 TaxID=3240045 RepID=UPI003D90E8E6
MAEQYRYCRGTSRHRRRGFRVSESSRMGLVVSARWLAYPSDQSYMVESADIVADALYDPALGQCVPAIGGLRVLHDPSKELLEQSIRQAFETASITESTLVLYFVGHGYPDDERCEYHFIPSDHPADYDAVPVHAYPLGERISALNLRFPGTDGLILMVDTCESGRLWEPERRAWTLAMPRAVIATATGRGSAWNADFTRVVGEGVQAGIPSAGYRLSPADFKPLLSELTRQRAHHFDHSRSDDEGLWISVNRASSVSRLTEVVRQVTGGRGLERINRRYQRPEGHEPVGEALRKHRMVAVLGPSGCGKSATLQMTAIDSLDLDRTGLDPDPRQPRQAVAFFPIAGDTAPVGFAQQIARQLDISSGGLFQEAEQDFLATLSPDEEKRLPAVERWLTGPLRHLPADSDVLIVIDALDQLPDAAGSEIPDCIAELDDATLYGHVRVVVSARHRLGYPAPALPSGFERIRVPPASGRQVLRYLQRRGLHPDHAPEIVRIADGNWLIITLLCNELDGPSVRDGGLPTTRTDLYNRLLSRACGGDEALWAGRFAPVLGVLASAGHDVAMPLPLLRAACALLDGPATVPAIRTVVVALRDVVERMDPGTDGEELTLIHSTLIEHLRDALNRFPLPDPARTHSAIASALATLAPMDRDRDRPRDSDPVRAYAESMEAVHRWEAGDLDGAVDVLIRRPALRAIDNRDRWTKWSRMIADRLGPVSLLSLRARRELASWTSRCGMFEPATQLYDRLLPDVTDALGGDDPLALRVELDAASFRGVSGHAIEARDRLDRLVSRIVLIAGPHSEVALEARHALGNWIGLAGAPREARQGLRDVLRDCREHLGEDHPETLAARNSLARWTGESGRPAQAVDEFRALLPLQERQLGPLHRETLRTRNNIAYWSGEAGRPEETLTLLRELIDDQTATLGEYHPDTLRTRHGIGLWTGVNGDPAEAIGILTGVLEDRVRILGPGHPDTLRTQNNIGRWTSVLGRYDEAIRILEEVRERRTRTLGAAHPDTMRTVNNIIDSTGACGDHAGALRLADELLPLQEDILGPVHQDTLRTRFNRAKWQAAEGDRSGALAALRSLLGDQRDALGPAHPDTRRTAEEIAALDDASG